jgi:hypothetical protein
MDIDIRPEEQQSFHVRAHALHVLRGLPIYLAEREALRQIRAEREQANAEQPNH